jgi:hypothetical protein
VLADEEGLASATIVERVGHAAPSRSTSCSVDVLPSARLTRRQRAFPADAPDRSSSPKPGTAS